MAYPRWPSCATAEAHGETATAWFGYGRTLVTLPLNSGRSSAVMTVGEADAAPLLRLDDAAFGAELTRRYRGRLEPMRPVGAAYGYMPQATTCRPGCCATRRCASATCRRCVRR